MRETIESTGTSIEDVAAESPELIFKEPIDIMDGLTDEAKLRMASNLGLEEGSEAHSKAVELMGNLYDMFLKYSINKNENLFGSRLSKF